MIRRNWRTILIFIALTTDIIAVILSGIFAYILRIFIPNTPYLALSVFIKFGILFGLALTISAMIIGVYRTTSHSNTERQYFLASKAYLYSILSLFSLLYLFQYDHFPRRFTLLFFLIVPFMFLIGRTFLNKFIRYMQRYGYGNHNVLLAGYDNGGINIINRFKNFPELGYDIKGIVTKKKNHALHPINIHGMMVQQFSMSELNDVVSEYQIDRVFVPSTNVITNGYSEILKLCRKKYIKLKVLSQESDSLLKLSHVYDIAGITLFSPQRKHIEGIKRLLKRLFDIVFSIVALLVSSPVLILTALTIFIESGKPILFKQRRASIKGGKTFYFYKFRSMIKNADAMKESLFELNESDGVLFKIKNDPRMTTIGKIIRKLSIDELPQLINVLKGEMSIVGPRPLPVGDLATVNVSKDFWQSIRDREKVKPGITGLWQISGRSNIGFREMIWLDLYYIENQSLLFDLEIIFATIPVVLFGRGAY